MPSNGHGLAALKQRVYESAIVVDRVDDRGEIVVPRGIKRATSRLGQALVEHGITPPWAMSREQCQAFWTGQSGDSTNAPTTYAAKETGVVDFLAGFWGPEVTTSDRVLEVGCNAGANLERLRQLGYSELQGIEINPQAIATLNETFPELAEAAAIRNATIEEGLAGMEADSVDVVFSMAVLIHLHPTSVEVFDELVRVSRRFVCVIELEQASNSYVFPRDYRRVFSRRGCGELRSTQIARAANPDVTRDYDGYVARLFRVP